MHQPRFNSCLSYIALGPSAIHDRILPKTWRTGIDSMIPKKTADLRPEKLRLILLLDARFNHGNKLIGKKMMEYGEKHNLLAPEQFGSRKSKSAIDHAINKRFTLDIIRQSKTNAIYIASDAKACYDRIILMVAYITMRNFGIPPLVAQSTIATIMNMKHHVRTCYGDSTEYYGGKKGGTKPHGCRQGNGYGPALWACISSPLLHILRQEGFGTTLFQPISGRKIHLLAFAFVDDTNIIQTHNMAKESRTLYKDEHIAQLFGTTQAALDLWSGTLGSTGGELEDSKTYYVPIIHRWKQHNPTLSQVDKGHKIYLKKADGSKTALEQKNSKDSFFTLGIWQSPSGDESRLIQYMTDKISEWSKNTTNNKISWILARIAIQATIGRTLAYPMAATTLNRKQCKSLQTHLLHDVLGKTGIVRTASATMVTAPTALGGLGCMSLFEVEQLIQHISIIMQHGPDQHSTTGHLLRATMEHHALDIGLPGDPLALPNVTYATKNTWISNIISSLREYNITIKSDIKGLQHWCDNDKFIMEHLHSKLPCFTLATINKVRLYLHVNTLSDLMVADGSNYDRNMLRGINLHSNPQPSYWGYIWPNVDKPTKTEQSLWTKTICEHFDIDLITAQGGIIRRCNKWEVNAIKHSMWTFSQATGLVYERQDRTPKWRTWITNTGTGYNTRRSGKTFVPTNTIHKLPHDAVPISIKTNLVELIITSFWQPHDRHSTDNGSPDIPHPNCNFTLSQSTYLYNIVMQNGVIFSDGSYDNGVASFAFLAQPDIPPESISQFDYNSTAHGSGSVEGTEWDIHSYRAELRGILAAIQFTNDACQSANIKEGACTLYCDSKGALYAAFGHKRPTPRWSSFDLVTNIRTAIANSPVT